MHPRVQRRVRKNLLSLQETLSFGSCRKESQNSKTPKEA